MLHPLDIDQAPPWLRATIQPVAVIIYRLYEQASGQQGYVTTRDAASAGFSSQLLLKHIHAGRVSRVQKDELIEVRLALRGSADSRHYVDASAFRDGVRNKRWTELDADFLERQHDALLFLGPESLPDYLPAYLTKLVTRDPALSAMPSFLLAVLTREGDGGAI